MQDTSRRAAFSGDRQTITCIVTIEITHSQEQLIKTCDRTLQNL